MSSTESNQTESVTALKAKLAGQLDVTHLRAQQREPADTDAITESSISPSQERRHIGVPTVGGLNIDRELKIHKQASKYGAPVKGTSELERHVQMMKPVPQQQESELSQRLKQQQQKTSEAELKANEPLTELQKAMQKRVKP